MDWLRKVFSAGLDASRVNCVGLALMLVGIVAVLCAGSLKKRLRPNVTRLIGLLICAGGALLAILG